MNKFSIGKRLVGANEPCLIVAEISANHNQSIDRAKQIIQAAKEAGADAIKLQTYTADTMTIDCDAPCFTITSNTLWKGNTLYKLYGEAHTPWEWHQELFQFAAKLGLICFSTPFDSTSVELLEALDAPVYKVASFEVPDLPLLEKIGQTKKPVIMSTGMATLSEIAEAVTTLRNAGSGPIALLKCTSAYPAAPESMNLRTIPHLQSTFNCVAGLSDHTMSSAVAIAAVALGAAIIEKHFTLARADGGPDSAFSLEPLELKQMVNDIRLTEKALGRICYERTAEELNSLCFRRSIFVVQDIKSGEAFTAKNVRCIRPADGLPPRYLSTVLSSVANKDIKRGTPLSWDLLRGAIE